jgi:hypothetical protein
MTADNKIVIEVMYKADYCLPCLYMDEAVRQVFPHYADRVMYRQVDFMRGKGRDRFLELSAVLFGEENVRKHSCIAPVPSIFIEENLVFETTPGPQELKAYIERYLAKGPGLKC